MKKEDCFFSFHKGEIYSIDSKKANYILILSNNTFNKINSFLEIIYLQKEISKNSHLLVEINLFSNNIYAICDQIHTINKENIKKYIGKITNEEIQAINEAISISMCLSNQNSLNHIGDLKKQNEKLEIERDIYKNFMIDLIKK